MKKIIFIVAALVVALCYKPIYVYMTGNTETVIVKNLEHKIINEHDTYLVFTDKGVFKNVDCGWRFKWNSSDVQNKIVAGKKFKIKYYGWRMPYWSEYPNIVTAEPVE